MFKYPATLLCLIFIAWLVARDCKRRPSVSWAVWIPTFFLMIVGSRSLSDWLGVGGGVTTSNGAERNPIDQLFFFSVLGICFLISLSRHVRWGKLFTSNLPLMAVYVFFALSVLWSDDPVGSTKRLFKDFGMLFVISVMLTEKDPLQAVRAVYVRCAMVLFPLSVLFIRYFPDMARDFSVGGEMVFSGVTQQKNSLGEIVMIFTLFLLWDFLETRPAKFSWGRIPWDRVTLLLMGVYLLRMSKSQTASMCLVFGSLLILRSGRLASRKISRAVLAGALSLPFLLFFAQKFSAFIAPMVEAMGRNMTFTGRTEIWAHLSARTVNPFIGAGYWNFWGGDTGLAIANAMQTQIPTAHCGYVDIYLDGGIVGLALLFFLLVAYGRRLARYTLANRFQRVRFAIFIVMIIYNLSESMYFRLSPIWFTTLLVMVDFPQPRASKRKLQKGMPAWEENAPLAPVNEVQGLLSCASG